MDWKTLLCDERHRPGTRQTDELRAEIVRDYGRVVFSTPVRRLQDKAQVFPLEPIDAVRTRLTHSLEVSSVARSLTHATCIELMKRGVDLTPDQTYEIESIAATVALIHDIGNPPFGHAGEAAIRTWFSKHEKILSELPDGVNGKYARDFLLFEGNAQTIRLLSTLQLLTDRSGLNLTYATLSAACKYVSGSSEADEDSKDHGRTKVGYFASEEALIKEVRSKTGTGDHRNPITFLVEASDDMVYSVVDVEDGIKKGVVSWLEVREIIRNSKQDISPELFEQTVVATETRVNSNQIGLRGRNLDEAYAQYFRTLVIGLAVKQVQDAYTKHYDEIMEGTYKGELLYDTQIGRLYKCLKKEVGRQRVYCAKENLRLELLGCNVIHDLLDIFSRIEPSEKSGTFEEKTFHLLSSNYQTVYNRPTEDEKNLPEKYRRLLLITDYVCGMTDTFALKIHRELLNG